MKNTYEKKSSIKNGVKRLIFIALSFIIETALIVLLFTRLVSYAEVISIVMRVIGIVLVLYIYGQPKTSAMKMPWIILILAVPVFGTAIFLTIGLNATPRMLSKYFLDTNDQVMKYLEENEKCNEELVKADEYSAGISHYIYNYAKYPVYENAGMKYFSHATDGLESMLEDLQKAEKFIFMEYFAIENDVVWEKIETILVEKVNQGVEVRVFYDDIGSIGFINLDFSKHLNSLGIQCKVFNPCVVGLKLILNHRDHRKITVIDGKIAYTGGFNLANEYFGVTHPYGMWKDTGIRITGSAVNSYTIAFLGMWHFDRKKKVVIDGETSIKPYLVDENEISKNVDSNISLDNETAQSEQISVQTAKGFIQPYADTPLDHENLGEDVYIGIINGARKYCYFMTPYLIITDEMLHALRLAAKRGVDVRIITPGIPDKKVVYGLTRSYYNSLISAGVRIFEWTPGFLHAKVCLSDDCRATCGTINLDYRSLYHNFEDGCFIIGTEAIESIRADFEQTFSEATVVTNETKYNRKANAIISGRILRLFAELM